MKNFKITEQQLIGIITYLKKQTYETVAEGIAMLSQLEEIKEEKMEEPKKEEIPNLKK